MKLRELIEKEGRRNNGLRNALEQGKFPSEEVAKQIGSEELYKIASNSVEFRIRVNLGILQSNYHIAYLIGLYIEACESHGKALEDDLDLVRSMRNNYLREASEITEELVRQQMRGYEAMW